MRYPTTLTAALVGALAALPALASAQGANHDVQAGGTTWSPATVAAALGDQVSWHPDPANTPHDVSLVPPGGNPDPAGGNIITVVPIDDPLLPGDPPATYAFDQQGSWQFICRTHSSFSAGQWSGMIGTVNVGVSGGDATPPTTTATLSPAAPGPGGTYDGPVTVTLAGADDPGGSGIASTTYRIDGDAGQSYAGPFTVSAAGSHTVAYASTDAAGNAEAEKEVTFRIAAGGSGEPSAELGKLPSKVAAGKLARGLRVAGRCDGVASGTLKLEVSKKAAKQLRLGRKATLASAKPRCDGGRFSTRLAAKGKAKQALRRLDGSINARLKLRMRGPDGAATDRATVKVTP